MYRIRRLYCSSINVFHFRIKEDNSRLQNELVAAKAHSLDIESFAKEQLEGKNVESILEQIKQKDSDERLKIEEKVWEARLQDASAKIEELEKENLEQREELTSKLEQELVDYSFTPKMIVSAKRFGSVARKIGMQTSGELLISKSQRKNATRQFIDLKLTRSLLQRNPSLVKKN